jgi:hypothetical protein
MNAEKDVRVGLQRQRAVASPAWFRLAVSVVVGAFFTLLLARQSLPRGYEAADLTGVLIGAREVLAGRSPFLSSVASDGTGPRMLSPMPAYLIGTPFTLMTDAIARAIWSGLAAAILTWYAISRHGLHGLAILVSRCTERALGLAQWSPFFFAGALAPGWQVILAAKPTIGLVVWCYRPSRWAFIGGAVLCGASFLLLPAWPQQWLSQMHGVNWYVPAAVVWRGGGPLLLLAALRWRRPEARLLLALACVPHNMIWYEQLLLFLVPATAVELWSLSLLSWVSTAVANTAFAQSGLPQSAEVVAFRAPIVALLYLPALAMVLRRPNVAPDA